MRELVERLCSRECAGRGAGTLGGIRARAIVVDALREAGLDPFEQKIGSSRGANVLAKTTNADVDRWVLVAAHYDHLGGDAHSGKFYPGADDNAAAVAILADVARAIVKAKPEGRGVLFAAFDAEEPPWFLTGEMGSAYFAKHAREAVGFDLDRIDTMVCMDLVGHALGSGIPLPDDVKNSVFALGAERSSGTAAIVDGLARAEDGVVVRRADAEIIPPLSDYDAFWKRDVPFVFLTSGRSARYHTPEDTPEHVDYAKVEATARWLERFVRASCTRTEDHVVFEADVRDDASSLRSFVEIVSPLAPFSPQARDGAERARELLAKCDARGRLPSALSFEPTKLLMALEAALA